MLTMSESPFLWQEDSSWWDYDEDGYTVHLNDNAPDYAVKSFEEYVQRFGNGPEKKRKLNKAS